MCVVVLCHQVVGDFPIVLGMNRDEFLSRPAEPPAVRRGRIPFVAPRDLERGGTWIGTNAAGVVCALTNRDESPPPPGRPSRGALVVEALSCGSAAVARTAVEERARSDPPPPFRLLVADLHDALLLEGPEPFEVRRLEPGVHLVSHRHGRIDPPAMLAALSEGTPDLLHAVSTLREFLSLDRPAGDIDLVPCRRLPDRGTRSSTILARGPILGRGLLLHAEGPPDRTPYEDLSSLLAEIAM